MWTNLKLVSRPIYTMISHPNVLLRTFIQIPENAIEFSFVRSSGPGILFQLFINYRRTECEQSQHKSGSTLQCLFSRVVTRVEIKMNVKSRDVKDRFINLEKNNINARGEFYITSSEERFQERNREIVLQKIQEKINRASIKPKERTIRRGIFLKVAFILEVNDLVKKNWVEEKRKRSELKQRRKGKENTIEHFSLVSSTNTSNKQFLISIKQWYRSP